MKANVIFVVRPERKQQYESLKPFPFFHLIIPDNLVLRKSSFGIPASIFGIPASILAGDAPRQKMNVRVPMDCNCFQEFREGDLTS